MPKYIWTKASDVVEHRLDQDDMCKYRGKKIKATIQQLLSLLVQTVSDRGSRQVSATMAAVPGYVVQLVCTEKFVTLVVTVARIALHLSMTFLFKKQINQYIIYWQGPQDYIAEDVL